MSAGNRPPVGSLVLVHWADIEHVTGWRAWADLTGRAEPDVYLSVGWVVGWAGRRLWLAGTRTNGADGPTTNCLQSYPLGVLRDIAILDEPRLDNLGHFDSRVPR